MCGAVPRAAFCAVDRDDVPACEHPDPGPHPRPDQPIEPVAVHGGERTPDRGLRWSAPVRVEFAQHSRIHVRGPLPDRRERACPGDHRRQAHRQDHRQAVTHTTTVAWIRYLLEQRQERRTGKDSRTARRTGVQQEKMT